MDGLKGAELFILLVESNRIYSFRSFGLSRTKHH